MHRGTPLFRATRVCLPVLLLAVALPSGCVENKPQHLMLPMQDGARLATDYYLPPGDGPWPVMLMRSTYGRAVGDVKDHMNRGIALVVQDVRGMGESEGEPNVFHAEGWRPGFRDGAETVAWIAAQPWCNGRIGTQGGSALAITQMLLAPATTLLHAQAMDVGPASFYHDAVYHGGVFRKKLMEGWLTAIKQPHVAPLYKAHPYYDEFWTFYDTGARAEDITAPGLFIGAWYDIFDQGTIDAFVSRETRGGPGARGNNYLVMKWGGHGEYKGEDYFYRKNTQDLRVSHLRKAFFDAHLLGDADALAAWPKVHYYVLGDDRDPDAPGNEWRTAETWPPFETVPSPYFLTADGGLDAATPAEPGSRTFTFDPNDPYPTHGGPNLLLPFGPYDQRLHSREREDLLIFATAPLEAPLEITGRVTCTLYVSSDAPDTDFTAKLVDVYPEPDGREINLLDGIIRVKCRDSLSQPAPLLTGPEEVVPVTIDLWTTSIVVNTGHRIALHVSSSNYPRFEVNPNTGADFPAEGEPMRAARNTVYTGGQYPSALTLPLRP